MGGTRSSKTASACKNHSSGLVGQKVGRVAMLAWAMASVPALEEPAVAPDVEALDAPARRLASVIVKAACRNVVGHHCKICIRLTTREINEVQDKLSVICNQCNWVFISLAWKMTVGNI